MQSCFFFLCRTDIGKVLNDVFTTLLKDCFEPTLYSTGLLGTEIKKYTCSFIVLVVYGLGPAVPGEHHVDTAGLSLSTWDIPRHFTDKCKQAAHNNIDF